MKLSAYTLLEAPFIYALCMEEHGKEFINSVVGQETSGGQYNKISLDSKRRPHNPMINTGQDSGNWSVSKIFDIFGLRIVVPPFVR